MRSIAIKEIPIRGHCLSMSPGSPTILTFCGRRMGSAVMEGASRCLGTWVPRGTPTEDIAIYYRPYLYLIGCRRKIAVYDDWALDTSVEDTLLRCLEGVQSPLRSNQSPTTCRVLFLCHMDIDPLLEE